MVTDTFESKCPWGCLLRTADGREYPHACFGTQRIYGVIKDHHDLSSHQIAIHVTRDLDEVLRSARADGYADAERVAYINGLNDEKPFTVAELFAHKNSLGQTFRELLADRLRAQAIKWHRDNDPDWRDRPWMDGVTLDLDEAEQVEYLLLGITAAIREIMGSKRYWTEVSKAMLDQMAAQPAGNGADE